MNNFSSFIIESINSEGIGEISIDELNQYIQKVSSKLPKPIQDVLYITKKYNILSTKDLDEIKNSPKTKLDDINKKFKMSSSDIETLRDILNNIGSNIRLLPQYQLDVEREAMLKGKMNINDLTIDLSTSNGRTLATKMYIPMVYKIVNQYVGKSKLDRSELISAALAGFSEAMKDYKRTDDGNKKSTTFKTYASYRVQQSILNDINEYGHSLSGTNWYATKKYGAGLLDATSIDGTGLNDDGEFKNDRLAALGEEPEPLERDEEKEWNQLFELIENSFKQRDVNVFYRYFGLHGYKREKSKDIAKSLGMSEGNIRNSILNKMILFLKQNKKATEILSNIQDIYNESLMCSMVDFQKDLIKETLINDDIFILLEELNRWNNKEIFFHSLYLAYENMDKKDLDLINILINGNSDTINDIYKKEKKTITKFLRWMYPTENINRKTDDTIIDYMKDIQSAYQKYKTK